MVTTSLISISTNDKDGTRHAGYKRAIERTVATRLVTSLCISISLTLFN